VQMTTSVTADRNTGNLPDLSKKVAGLKPLPPGSPGANNTHAPWLNDQFQLMLGAHVAAFDLNTCANGSAPTATVPYYDQAAAQLVSVPACSNGAVKPVAGFLPYDSGDGMVWEPLKNLLACANNADPNAKCVLSTSPPASIHPADAKSIISQDPFAATALGYVTPPSGAGSGQNVDPTAVLKQPGADPIRSNYIDDTRTGGESFSQGNSTDTLHTWDASSSYSTGVEAVDTNKISLGFEADIPLDIVSVGISASVSYTNESTLNSSFTMNFDKSASTDNQSSWLSTADLENRAGKSLWPNHMTLYLDPRFDTIMFQVPPPGITSVKLTQKGKNVNAVVQDLQDNTALDTGELDVFLCPQGATTGCANAQKQVVDGLAKKMPNATDPTTVHSSLKKFTLAPGTSYDVYVSSPGGLAGPFTWSPSA
jgi:hypothetical protein